MVKVDRNKCIGCGLCVSICPKVFKLKDGKSSVVDPKATNTCDIEAAIKGCPAQAISK
ncbi:MAG: ferredoxin [Candidatus Aenigmarchaeota archaeon]|nr:ferredoxin [Candidatus Aenigmarchaeota archaeon]